MKNGSTRNVCQTNPRHPRSILSAGGSITADCLVAPPRLYWILYGHKRQPIDPAVLRPRGEEADR